MRTIGLALIFTLAICQSSYSLSTKIDSLSQQLKIHTELDSIRVDILNKLAYEYIHTNSERLHQHIRASQKILEEISYPKGSAQAFQVLAVSFWVDGQYNFAIDYYLQALEKFKQVDYKTHIYECYKSLGSLYKLIGQYDLSLIYHEQSLEISKKHLSQIKVVFSYINIAGVYFLIGDIELSKEYYEKALIISVENDNVLTKASSYAGLGQVYVALNDVDRGVFYLEKSLKIKVKKNRVIGIIDVSKLLGDVYFDIGSYEIANDYYISALEIAKKHNAVKSKIIIYEKLFSLDSTLKNYNTALVYNYRLNYLKDSMNVVDKENQLARIKTIYEVDKKDKQNALLLKDKEANDKIQQYQKLMNIGGIFALWILGVMSIALFRQLKQQRKDHNLLQIKTEEINIQKDKLISSAKTLKELNENLEKTVKERTGIILKKNKKLSEFAYMNAHNVRGPLSNILGLTYLLKKLDLKGEEKELISHLKDSAEKLDTEFHILRKDMENEERS